MCKASIEGKSNISETIMIDITRIDFSKTNGLIPACIQEAETAQVLMIGFMNQEALQQTLDTKKVTFYSRRKQRLWVKGETSGYELELTDILVDCDQDALLCLVKPKGPTCHVGTNSCFQYKTPPKTLSYALAKLQHTITKRAQESGQSSSYTQQLLQQGTARIAQKIGEEGVEVALSAVIGSNEQLCMEIVDLLYHLWVLLFNKNISLNTIAEVMQSRSNP